MKPTKPRPIHEADAKAGAIVTKEIEANMINEIIATNEAIVINEVFWSTRPFWTMRRYDTARIARWRRFVAFIKATKRRHQASSCSNIIKPDTPTPVDSYISS